MTQKEHVYAICFRPEVDDDVISFRNVKNIKGYIVVNFEVASFSSFQDIPKRLFCGGEVGDGSVNVIWKRSEVPNDAISCEDAEIFQEYVCINARKSKSYIY